MAGPHTRAPPATGVLAANRQVAGLLSAVPGPRRKLVTNHDTFAYFAHRYGFEVVGTALPGRVEVA